MSIGLIGKKIGMRSEFYDSGTSVPVTVLHVEKGRIIDVFTKEKSPMYSPIFFNNVKSCHSSNLEDFDLPKILMFIILLFSLYTKKSKMILSFIDNKFKFVVLSMLKYIIIGSIKKFGWFATKIIGPATGTICLFCIEI